MRNWTSCTVGESARYANNWITHTFYDDTAALAAAYENSNFVFKNCLLHIFRLIFRSHKTISKIWVVINLFFFFSHCSIICNLPWLVIRLSADFTWNNSDSLLSIFRFLFSQLKALREICFLPWIYLNTIHWQTVSINLFWSSTFFLMDELKKQFCFESLFFLRFYVFDSCSFPSSFLQAVTCVTICYYPSKLYPIG